MEKIIEIDITNESDLYQKYNKKMISNELISYILEITPHFGKTDELKIIINNGINKPCKQLIIDALKKEYNKSVLRNSRNNWVQITYLLIGIVILFLSTLTNETISKEVLLIVGWVFIWAMMELQIFTDVRGIKKRKIIKKLLKSEIIEKNI